MNNIPGIFTVLKCHKALTIPIKALPEVLVTKHSVVNCTKLGGCSSAIRVASRLEGPADNAQGRNSSCPPCSSVAGQPRRSEYGAPRLTNRTPTCHALIMIHDRFTSTMRPRLPFMFGSVYPVESNGRCPCAGSRRAFML